MAIVAIRNQRHRRDRVRDDAHPFDHLFSIDDADVWNAKSAPATPNPVM